MGSMFGKSQRQCSGAKVNSIIFCIYVALRNTRGENYDGAPAHSDTYNKAFDPSNRKVELAGSPDVQQECINVHKRCCRIAWWRV